MKKILGLCLAAIFTASNFVSCSTNASKPTISTDLDSINYAFGAANAMGVRQYLLGGDSVSTDSVKNFCIGFEKTFKPMDSIARVNNEGLRLGWNLQQEFSKGFLFNDSTITARPELMSSRLEATLNGENWVMTQQECEGYFTKHVEPAMRAGVPANLTDAQIDTVNMVLGYLNATAVRQYMLGKDTANACIKSFIKGFDKGVKAKGDQAMMMEGMRVGAGMYGQLKTSPFLMNDPSIPANIDIIKFGFLSELNNVEGRIMTGAEADIYVREAMELRAAAKAAEFTAEGDAFLAENAQREGIIVTESGLQYEVISMGTGAKPAATDKVKVHYHGTFINGEVFDSSVERGEPIEFGLNQVIRGWTEGVQLMPVGSKFRFYIPYNLAYGEQGRGGIPPYATLIFDIELFDIVK